MSAPRGRQRTPDEERAAREATVGCEAGMVPLGNARVESVVSDDPREAPGERTYLPANEGSIGPLTAHSTDTSRGLPRAPPTSHRVRTPDERLPRKEPSTA